MVEALGDGIGELLFGPEVIEEKIFVSAEHSGDLLEWGDATAQSLVDPDLEESASPDWTFVAPELLESLLQLPGAGGVAQTAEHGVEFGAGLAAHA